ncbi:DNA/RNA non-specific endonuclease [Candidatus Protochlamydia phocaeensis]|uniref:DNA/RNA non-specific endonuclease n=1 Tax=Candidatus Protochlamydia phocaeensis TaxID=1414722 RepID=UPI0008390B27|nr:DNA/RNA non-specific endonuclease [Candidatus Protochlamydia phocaeensis]
MKKKSSSHFSFRPSSWITALCLGIGIGITSQRIPELRAYTNQVVQPIEQQVFTHQYTQESRFSGQPISSFHINRPGYSLAYDARNRNPAWVYEHLTAESIKGDTDRSHSDFKEDDSIPPHLRATLTDYRGSGFDRGHMAPAADHRSSPSAMADTFFMTNMCPQCPELNRGYWSKLEKHVRDLTKQYANIHVVTGPLYLPYTDVDGKRYVKYQVLGSNRVAVPTHFFKVLTLDKGHGQALTIAYILPNEPVPSNTPLEKFQTSVQKVEQAAGILFNPANNKF